VVTRGSESNIKETATSSKEQQEFNSQGDWETVQENPNMSTKGWEFLRFLVVGR
jgi:hypothetical protein